MNGRKARERRRNSIALPPDLKQEMKERIRGVASQRADKLGAARKEREAAIAAAYEVSGKAFQAAWDEFENRRAEIVASFEAKAAARTKREAKEAA